MRYDYLLIRGPAGSGKTTISLEIFRRLRRERNLTSYFSFDRIYLSYFASCFNRETMLEASDFMCEMIERQRARTYFGIIDGVFSRPVYERVRTKLPGNLCTITLKAPLDLCLERNREREGIRKLPDQRVRNIWQQNSQWEIGKVIDSRKPKEEIIEGIYHKIKT